jgi:dTDP-4-amino-4,6-dideoxygalactose transaminase
MHGKEIRGKDSFVEAAAVAAAHCGEVARFIAVDRQHGRLEIELYEAFSRRLASSAFASDEEVERFEADFAEYCEASHCVGIASGTAALALTLSACGIGPGDEVIVPAHTFVTSALAVLHAGATPVLCDVQDGTGLIDARAAHAAIGPRTAAIIAVHLFGQVCDMGALDEIARKNGLIVLEDGSHAPGARYRGRRAGSIGTAAVFSFQAKNLGTLGDGGAVCTGDPVVAARLRRLRESSRRADELGRNQRLDGLQAALLRVKLSRLDEWADARRAHALRYRALLSPEVRLVEERRHSPSIYHVFPARFENRDSVAATLRAHDVGTAVHYSPTLRHHPVLRDANLGHGAFPVAEAWADEELSLPMHPDLQPQEIERVVRAVHAAIGGVEVPVAACAA